MTANVHIHTELVEGCHRCELNQDEAADEARFCQAIVVQGRFYLSNGDPGYPDEYCDNEAIEGSEFCADHQGEDFWDAADRAYEEARDRRLEEADND